MFTSEAGTERESGGTEGRRPGSWKVSLLLRENTRKEREKGVS